MLSRLLKPFRSDLAIYISGDRVFLGTHSKLLAKEAACVALHKETRRALAVGNEALAMEGREPSNIVVIRPIRFGMVWEMDSAEAMLRYLLKKHTPGKLIPPRVVVCGNCNGETAKRGFKELLTSAGASEVMLLQTGIASAMGVGIKIEEPDFNIVLNLERDWLEVAVISLAGVAAESFAPIGFGTLMEDVALYANEALRIEPDPSSLEASLRSTGFGTASKLIGWTAWIDSLEYGRELASDLSPEAIAKACAPTLLRLRRVLAQTLQQLPKEKRMLLTVAPIHLTGGFSDIPGLAALLSQRLGHTVKLHPNSQQAAYDGTAMVLSELNDLLPYIKPQAK